MRILHVVKSIDPADGGPPASVSGLAAAQASLGCEVTILCHEIADRRKIVNQAVAQIPGFERVNLSFVADYPGRRSTSQLAQAVRASDVVHLHGIWRPLLFQAAWEADRVGINFVVAPRGMLAPWSLSQKRLKKQLGLLFGWKYILKRAAFLQALNADEARQFDALRWLNRKIEVIPNGVFSEQFTDMDTVIQPNEIDPRLNTPYILFLGRLHYVKGLDVLANAFALFAKNESTTNLIVVGPDLGAKASFLRRIDTLGISNRVHTLGPIYGARKQAVLAGALCLCQPSRQEGFSMTITETMASGVPVVITKSCHFPEVAEVGAGLVVDLSAEDIANALLHIVRDEANRKKSGELARQLVLSKFTWPTIAERSIKAYIAANSADFRD